MTKELLIKITGTGSFDDQTIKEKIVDSIFKRWKQHPIGIFTYSDFKNTYIVEINEIDQQNVENQNIKHFKK